MIAGLAQQDSGRIFFNDIDAQTISLKDRRIGFVFQNYALFRHMTVFDNVAYGLKVRPRRERPSKCEIKERVMALLELMQLNGLEARYPAQLSGGQCQRVAIARALAIEPQVLLLDEPFGALDAKVRKDLRAWLREVHERTGHTTVFVTHDQEEALELADRVAILNKGQLEQIGTPEQIFHEPASAFVCAFLGESTCLNVDVRHHQVMFEGRMVYAAPSPIADGAARMFVRPDGWQLVDPAHPQASISYEPLQGILSRIRLHGLRRRAEVRVQGLDNPLEIDLPPIHTPFTASLHSGAHVEVRIDHARVFSGGSEALCEPKNVEKAA
jgi:sulfate transport system ATP-binding protein